jgi:lipoprotein-releasing system ATP-binding protein
MTSVLELININKNFFQGEQKIIALKDASLNVAKGEITALVGYSGSGKTTLLQIAGLLDSATSGTILINGIDASKANDAVKTEIRKNNIGFIFQSHHLLPEFSALENVAMPLLIHGKSRKESFAEAEKILTEVELENRIHHKPAELSGGQQQRVAIARAIVTKPSLILADEPTGNLDSELSERVFLLLNKLAKNYEIGCLIVTHNSNLAAKTDRIIQIKDGEIS